jgi:hypothetical protein
LEIGTGGNWNNDKREQSDEDLKNNIIITTVLLGEYV